MKSWRNLLPVAVFALLLMGGEAARAGVLSRLRAAKPAPGKVAASAEPPPAITKLLKPEALHRILEDREIVTNASLEDVEGSETLRRYTYYASMLVHSSLSRTREALTDYRAYAKMVPYVDRAEFVREPDLIRIEGGIWKFKLNSQVLFEEKSERWIRYRIVAGHFRGLSGDILFEPQGEKGTLVYMRGEQQGPRDDFPPKFVIEKGAEIVFAFTAKRMRSYVEDANHGRPASPPSGTPGSEIPQPRNRL
ncbi:MAG TPA: hypothetical protein VM598_10070 [Bdellovibrionota bacterium]|nr:hypothetical protein [Bdellovibrionota bacterium]